MSNLIPATAFKVVEGRPVTSSPIVAEFFGKRHSDVVRAIDDLIAKKQEFQVLRNFARYSETVNLNDQGATRQVPAYWMDRKGFTILAMGFTGDKALEFKCAFYDQFERMEEALRNPPKPEYISVEHRWAIQKAVGRKARGQSVNYQTVYRALKDHFKVEKYTHILEADFDAAIAFIESLPPMQLPPLNAPAPKQLSAAPQKEPRKFLVDERYMERQRTFIYYVRYLFREELDLFIDFMHRVDSPRAGQFWEAVHGMHLSTAERDLAKLGFDVKDLDCYKSWASHQPKRLTA
ncbi:Rha family transcriptional regulator [Sutterella wadsworthensis]|uniref:Rha family transcriptional regulator n=1 Tax=Sutterella wadsworthensis TaxID=40545 RepID=UPI000E03B8C5|nr:Rha family transcriptional regulator [Sutterella wadsworthensis]RBP52341.1 Rha family phage regulatory protein [Sutterella wadsworthensis]